jgi:hypothetical protein
MPAFSPPLAGLLALVAVVTLTQGPFLQRLIAVWREPIILLLFLLAAIYCLYWFFVNWLVLQFIRGRKLSLLPLGYVAVTDVITMIAVQPWHASSEPFSLGPASLLHVAFMATVALPSLLKSIQERQQK